MQQITILFHIADKNTFLLGCPIELLIVVSVVYLLVFSSAHHPSIPISSKAVLIKNAIKIVCRVLRVKLFTLKNILIAKAHFHLQQNNEIILFLIRH